MDLSVRRRRPKDQGLDAAAAAVVDAAVVAKREPRRQRVRREPNHRSRASRMLAVRITLVAIMGTALALLGGRAFDEFVPALLLPPPTIALVALLMRRRRVTLRAALALAVVVTTSAAAALFEGTELRSLAGDAVAGPRRLFTTEWPSPLDPGVVFAVALLVGTVTAVAADLAGRPRFHVAPLGVIAGGFAAVMAIAAPVHPVRSVLVVLAAAAVLLLLARPGDDPRTRLRLVFSERSSAVTVLGLVAAGLIASSALAWADRADPRQEVDAEVTLSLLDPVEQMSALRNADPRVDLFRIRDRSALIGPSLPTRWRLSALTEYDGQRWLPALTLRPIGSRLSRPSAANPAVAPPIRFDLRLLSDDIALVPLPGRPLEVQLADGLIETDADRTVVRLVDAPEKGLLMRVTSEIAPAPAAADSTAIANRLVDELSGSFEADALAIAGDGTVLEQLRTIETTMKGWVLDSRAPGAGQQLALIERFVSETQRGTREQFVTAFVLFARSLGVDARIATGFLVPPDELKAPLVLRSSHATVWPEVRLTDLGWLAFDPVPDEEAGDDDSPTPPPSRQSPTAAQPPIEERPDRNDDTEAPPSKPETSDEQWSALRVWVTRGAIAGGAASLPVVISLATILVVKRNRRRRRLRATDPATRIVGAWASATDSLVDAGLAISPAWTDERIAEHASLLVPAMPSDVRRLASNATAMTFGLPHANPTLADNAVAVCRSVDDAIRLHRTRWQRMRWRLSTRSLRKSTRSPVSGGAAG